MRYSVQACEFGWNHQDSGRYQEFVKELNLTGITKSPAKHLQGVTQDPKGDHVFYETLYVFLPGFFVQKKKSENRSVILLAERYYGGDSIGEKKY